MEIPATRQRRSTSAQAEVALNCQQSEQPRTPRKNVQAAGDRLRIHHQRLEELPNEIQITKACESARFMSRVSIGQYFIGGKTGACRDYALPRDNSDSELIAWIVDTPGSVQFFKSKSYVGLINMESKYRHRQHQETDQNPGLFFPEAQTATWRSRGMTQKLSRKS